MDESPACTQAQTIERHQLEIAPRGPFRLDLTAWALRRRSHNAVDRWDSATYERVVSLAGGPVALSVTQVAGPEAPRLSVLLAGRRVAQRAEALARDTADRLLGLSVDLSPFAAMAAPDPLLGPLAARMRGLKPPRFPTVFEALVNGVACQQLSLDVGIHLLNRLAADRGRAVSDAPDSPHACPDPEDLASLQPDDLKRHGFSSTARGWRGDRAPDQPAWRRPLDGRVCAPPRDGAPACLSWTRRRRAKQAQAVVRDRDTAGLRGGRPDGGALGIPKQALSTSICCSTPCPALRVRSPGEAGRW
jgi:hypothetical protein